MDKNRSEMLSKDDPKFIVRFLCSFFSVFHAYIIDVQVRKNRVEGIVMYADNDIQQFVWHYSDLSRIEKSFQILDILLEGKWINNDKIVISRQMLAGHLDCLGWNKKDISETINSLLSFRVNMVDDGEETDSFFIHF